MARNAMYDLAWEVKGDSIDLEQGAGFGDVTSVTLHAMQVRLIASEMGLMRGDLDAWERVARLERRFRLLCDRVSTLDKWLAEDVGKDGVDLSLHSTFCEATALLADEWCAEMAKDSQTLSTGTETVSKTAAAQNRNGTQRKPKENPAGTRGIAGDQPALALEEAK